MRKKAAPIREFDSYTSLARAFGVSVHALKMVLASEGYLDPSGPTERARSEEAFKRHEIANGIYSNGPAVMLLWRTSIVAGLMAARGVAKTENGIWNVHRALSLVHDAGELYAEVLADNVPDSVFHPLCSLRFEGVSLLVARSMHDREIAAAWLERQRDAVEAYIAGSAIPETSDLLRARQKMDAVFAWLRRPARPSRPLE